MSTKSSKQCSNHHKSPQVAKNAHSKDAATGLHTQRDCNKGNGTHCQCHNWMQCPVPDKLPTRYFKVSAPNDFVQHLTG